MSGYPSCTRTKPAMENEQCDGKPALQPKRFGHFSKNERHKSSSLFQTSCKIAAQVSKAQSFRLLCVLLYSIEIFLDDEYIYVQ